MFLINLYGKESIHEQIRSQILKFIKLGVLKENDKLPSVRELAKELGINPNTVLKAYQELESEGFIYMLSKKGAFIASNDKIKKEELYEEFNKMLIRLKDNNLDKEYLKIMIDEVYSDVRD